MDCTSCGSANPEGKKFCGACGAELPVRCAACGAENPFNNRFCGDCGTVLTFARVSAPDPISRPAAQRVVSPSAERRQLTVMFCDLVGSTALASRIDPEEMRQVLRAFQNAVTGEIARLEGHVAKLMGDGVLAYFGWPRAHEDEAERAVRSGLAIGAAVARLRTPAAAPLSCRVGIATGLVVVGDLVGEGSAQEEAVVGETPNLAARLQELADPGSVIVSDATRRLLGELFVLTALRPQLVKGFAEPIRAYRVESEAAAEGRFEAHHGAVWAPLVGRAQELALLLGRWEQARLGEGQVVLLSGEPGIGKSRLVQALREATRGERRVSLRYHGSPYHANDALWPIAQQLVRAAEIGRDDPIETKLDKLEELLARAVPKPEDLAPLLANLLELNSERYPTQELTPQQQKVRVFQALLAQLEGLARQTPVLIVGEDVHWCDPTTMELFEAIVERLQRWPALLVVTLRPELLPPWTRFPHVTLLMLNRLGRSDTTALIDNIAGGRSLPASVLDAILTRTEGVPLFAEELTKAILESGLLRETADGLELAGALAQPAIPNTLQELAHGPPR